MGEWCVGDLDRRALKAKPPHFSVRIGIFEFADGHTLVKRALF